MYVAAHHGNKSGFSSKLFELFKPKLTIISAGKYRDFDGTYLYDQIMDDEFIIKSGQKSKKVKVISTRNNGNIKISIYDYKEPIVEQPNFKIIEMII